MKENKIMRGGLAGLMFALAAFSFSSCNDGGGGVDTSQQLANDVAAIDSYLAANNINAIKDPSGVRIRITSMGDGLPASIRSTSATTDSVNVDYSGKLFSTGAVFDDGTTTGLASNYIDGWKIALSVLPKGTVATLYIPSVWGYGTQDKGSIPPNSILVFDIRINDVKMPKALRTKLASDKKAIDTYLATKGIEATKDSSGIRFVASQGVTPSWFDKVTMTYSIKLLTDDTKSVADVERAPGADFLSRVVDYIPGMKAGLQKIPAGTTGTLYIPSVQAWGSSGATNNGSQVIPPDANVIVEVKLTKIEQ